MLVFVLGLSGNGLVIFTVWRGPRAKRRPADTYIGNLALADLAFVVTLPLWAAYTALRFHWPFGSALCKLSSYLVLLNMFASAFCLGGLSFDRYLAIVAEPDNLTVCDMDFSAVASPRHERYWAGALSLGTTALGFLLPLLLMTLCYCCIGAAVSRHFRQLRKEGEKRRRLLRIIVTLVAVFALCWLPFHLLKSLYVLSGLRLLPLPCALLALIARLHPYATCLAYIGMHCVVLWWGWRSEDRTHKKNGMDIEPGYFTFERGQFRTISSLQTAATCSWFHLQEGLPLSVCSPPPA
ncbi:apelin receptor A-like isoform C [Alligator mississippiensis]|uniref:Apelin receptor A-like isoform C n=1 Tax=Alligator mississippiensis TaxID=8496 RepID=A0A151NDL6_ALLMI|nr:apelin receptor A-like isoform C [Alligator mississippiensis]